ncbi:MAG: nucleotidyltransferase [Lachnospiraceae bacterium]|nr:nucleotidyltransferase [Lachnospiraceae bacterium]
MEENMSTLVVMAAGMGSRFGGIKQLEPIGPNGEIIIDYSIHDAIEAGFDKVVFIIRKDIEKDFKEVIGDRLAKKYNVSYVFQDMNDIPEGFEVPKGRTKPWGTGQAVLSVKGVVNEPFVVINSDDYYGKEGFVKLHKYLEEHTKAENGVYPFCMAGFKLGNTLSDNGTVTRGVCKVDDNKMLTEVNETFELKAIDDDKVLGKTSDGVDVELGMDTYVSMNMWGFTPEFIEELEKGFPEFLGNVKPGDLKAEYLLPTIVSNLLQNKKATVKVLDTNDYWYGITYKEDKEAVVNFFNKLSADNVYPKLV